MSKESANTAIKRDGPSLPCRRLWYHDKIKGPVILDYGCGHGADMVFLRYSGGFERCWGWDPNHFPASYYKARKYDTILCTYVLNVVRRKMQRPILDEIKRLLKKDGVAYITVRADVETGVTSKGTYQRKVKLPYEKVWENQSFVTYKVTKEQL
jgi:ubiquinone/menaquinone biosynthesis C-methylase UbiE